MREKLTRELKSTLSGKLFQILTTRSLKNLCRTAAERRFLYSLLAAHALAAQLTGTGLDKVTTGTRGIMSV